MTDRGDRERLRAEQERRAETEREAARRAAEEEEERAHARRAERARYLEAKLDEQAEADDGR